MTEEIENRDEYLLSKAFLIHFLRPVFTQITEWTGYKML